MATHSSVLAWRIPGRGSLVGCRLWGHTESDMTEAMQQAVRQQRRPARLLKGPPRAPGPDQGTPDPPRQGHVPGATPGAAQQPLSLLLGGLGPRPVSRRRRKPQAGARRGRWVWGASAEPTTAGSSPALLSCTAPGSRPQPEPRAALTASRPHGSLPEPRQEAGDRKSTRLNSSHRIASRMPSSA